MIISGFMGAWRMARSVSAGLVSSLRQTTRARARETGGEVVLVRIWRVLPFCPTQWAAVRKYPSIERGTADPKP